MDIFGPKTKGWEYLKFRHDHDATSKRTFDVKTFTGDLLDVVNEKYNLK